MGCDIHAYIEQKIDNKWQFISEEIFNRCYLFFTVLAGVRNRNNFPVEIISSSKGIPSDISEGVQNEYDSWYGDGHSASCLTKKEFEKYPWDSDITLTAYVSMEEYKVFIQTGTPNCWSSYVSSNVVSITEMNELLKSKIEKDVYCNIVWTEKLNNNIGESYDQLKKIFDSPDENRLVYWFDN